jgi:hypothetical protein
MVLPKVVTRMVMGQLSCNISRGYLPSSSRIDLIPTGQQQEVMDNHCSYSPHQLLYCTRGMLLNFGKNGPVDANNFPMA